MPMARIVAVIVGLVVCLLPSRADGGKLEKMVAGLEQRLTDVQTTFRHDVDQLHRENTKLKVAVATLTTENRNMLKHVMAGNRRHSE
jgi:hypothetical protein